MAVVWGTCKFNAAADRLLRTANPPVGAGPYTIMLDVKFNSDTDLHQTIIGLGPAASSYILASCSPTMVLYGEGGNSTISFSGAGQTFVTNTWYTVVMKRGASANQSQLFVNDMATEKMAGTGAQGTPYTRFEFGGFGTGNLHRLDGYVRRILWWAALRTQAELEAQIPTLAAIVRTNLEGEYLFNETNGNDSSGNARHFTVSGSPTIVASVNEGGGGTGGMGLGKTGGFAVDRSRLRRR